MFGHNSDFEGAAAPKVGIQERDVGRGSSAGLKGSFNDREGDFCCDIGQ